MLKIESKTLLVFLIFDLLFLATSVLHLVIPAIDRQKIAAGPSIGSVAQALLLSECPLTAAMINGLFGILTFLVSVPALIYKKNHIFLTVFCYLLIVNALFTLGVGLSIWYSTLQTKANLAPLYNGSSDLVQSMLQWKFQCCGYTDTAKFIKDDVCTSLSVAAAKGPCVTSFASFANNFLDIIFTTMFGFCALDGLTLLSCLCVMKDRAERARYVQIDEKRDYTRVQYSRI